MRKDCVNTQMQYTVGRLAAACQRYAVPPADRHPWKTRQAAISLTGESVKFGVSHWPTRSVCPILAHVRQTIVQRIIEDRRRACDIPGTARIVRGLAMTGVVHCSAAGRSKPCQPVSDEPGLLIQETVPAFDSGRSDKRAQ